MRSEGGVGRLVGGTGLGWRNGIQIPAFAGMTEEGGNDGGGENEAGRRGNGREGCVTGRETVEELVVVP